MKKRMERLKNKLKFFKTYSGHKFKKKLSSEFEKI